MQDPSPQAYAAGLGVLSYLHTNKDLGITYGGRVRPCAVDEASSTTSVIAFADSSFGRSVNPFGGGFVEWRNGAIAWASRKMKFVPLSTCQAELAMINMMLKEAICATHILEDMGMKMTVPHVVNDGKSAIDTVKNPGMTKKSTHFERWLQFARDLYLKKQVHMFACKTDLMMGDNMTKVTDKTKFFACRNYQMNIK